MSTSDHIKQQVVQEFFCQKGLILLENDKNGILFCKSGRSRKHIKNMFHIPSRGSVAHCFKLLHNV